MILSIEFLQDVPIPQKGTTTSRKFFVSDGWTITPLDGFVRLARDHEQVFDVVGVGYVARLEMPTDVPLDARPSPERAVDQALPQMAAAALGITPADVTSDPTPKKPLKKGKRS